MAVVGCSKSTKTLDVQGHRGARGLYPENSTHGMLKALEFGVSTLEMDVVITKDSIPILSHEPFISSEIGTHKDGASVTEEEEKSLNIFQMTFAELSKFDCGKRGHHRFPEQEKMAVNKPKLEEMLKTVGTYCKENALEFPLLNIETKCTPVTDKIYHPEPSVFVDLIMEVIQNKGVEKQMTLQSFDVRTLQYANKKYPNLKLALLVEGEEDFNAAIETLGFEPDIYSCDFTLINQDLIDYCGKKKIELIPWTVNEKEDMITLINKNVDGIISDYPNRLIEVCEEMEIEIL